MPTFGNGSVEIYINLGNNSRLDPDGFRPFGRVDAAGMAIVERLYAGYGEMDEPDVCTKLGTPPSFIGHSLEFTGCGMVPPTAPIPPHPPISVTSRGR